MAIVKNGILFSKVNGSIGNVVLTEDKAGRQIAREKPSNVFNPRTESQQGTRTKFSATTTAAKTLASVLPRFFRREPSEPRYQTARNRFVSQTMKTGVTEHGTFDPSGFVMVRGNNSFTPDFSLGISQNAGTVELVLSNAVSDATKSWAAFLFSPSLNKLLYTTQVNLFENGSINYSDLESGIWYAGIFIFETAEYQLTNNLNDLLFNPYSTYEQAQTLWQIQFVVN